MTAWWRNDPSPPFLPARPVVNDLLTLHSGSIRLKVYGVERTLVACCRNCSRLGMAPVLEALKDAINQRRLNVDELWRQAQAPPAKGLKRQPVLGIPVPNGQISS